MGNTLMKRSAKTTTNPALLPVRTSVSAAVLVALYGIPHLATAEQPVASTADTLEEVIVTAGRREQTLEEVPYNLTVISADDIARAGVKDIASLTYQVPGL